MKFTSHFPDLPYPCGLQVLEYRVRPCCTTKRAGTIVLVSYTGLERKLNSEQRLKKFLLLRRIGRNCYFVNFETDRDCVLSTPFFLFFLQKHEVDLRHVRGNHVACGISFHLTRWKLIISFRPCHPRHARDLARPRRSLHRKWKLNLILSGVHLSKKSKNYG